MASNSSSFPSSISPPWKPHLTPSSIRLEKQRYSHPPPPPLPQLSQCHSAQKLFGECVRYYPYRSVNFFLQGCNFQSNFNWMIYLLPYLVNIYGFLHMLSMSLYPDIPQWMSHSQLWKSILLTFVYRKTKTAQSNYSFFYMFYWNSLVLFHLFKIFF